MFRFLSSRMRPVSTVNGCATLFVNTSASLFVNGNSS